MCGASDVVRRHACEMFDVGDVTDVTDVRCDMWVMW